MSEPKKSLADLRKEEQLLESSLLPDGWRDWIICIVLGYALGVAAGASVPSLFLILLGIPVGILLVRRVQVALQNRNRRLLGQVQAKIWSEEHSAERLAEIAELESEEQSLLRKTAEYPAIMRRLEEVQARLEERRRVQIVTDASLSPGDRLAGEPDAERGLSVTDTPDE